VKERTDKEPNVTKMINSTATPGENEEPHQALAERTPSIAAACEAMRSATSPSERARAQEELRAVVDSNSPLSPADRAAVAVALAGVFAPGDRATQLQIILHAAYRARRAGALRVSIAALREAQLVSFDMEREAVIDEITSDLVRGRYHTVQPSETTPTWKKSDAGSGPTGMSSSPATPPTRPTMTKSGAGRRKKKAAGAATDTKATDAKATAAKTTGDKSESPAPSAQNERPLVVARAMERLTADDLAHVPPGPSMAFVTVLSAATADGFLGTVGITQNVHGERTWRCPGCGAGAGELHVTGSRRLECAACRDHVGVNWRSFGPEVTALIERMTRGERIPAAVIVDAVARHMETTT